LPGSGDRLELLDGASRFVTVLGAETINGGNLNDFITLGAAGTVRADLEGNALGDRLTLFNGGVNIATVTGVETVIGGVGADQVIFTDAVTSANRVTLGAGLDLVSLSGADDEFRLVVGNGIETVNGGAGNDTVSFEAGAATAVTLINFEVIDGANASGNNSVTLAAPFAGTVDLGGGSDRLNLAAGTNTVTVQNVEVVNGNVGNDAITVTGTVGAVLRGLGGNDVLTGGAGRDQLRGGIGADTLEGNGGADVFIFANAESSVAVQDTVLDFEFGVDLLLFTGMLRGDFTWQGNAATFTATGNSQARMAVDGLLEIDADGNGVADSAINMTGVTVGTLSQSDFLWL
jgi:Ca2+-binding RTX toxin-like protein